MPEQLWGIHCRGPRRNLSTQPRHSVQRNMKCLPLSGKVQLEGKRKNPHKTNHAEAAVGRVVNEFGIKRFVLTQGRWLHSQVGFSLFMEAVGAGVSSQRSAAVKLKYLTTHYSHRSHHFSRSILGTRQLLPRWVNQPNPKFRRILPLTERPFSFFLSLPPQKAVNAVGYSGSECHLDTIFCVCA